MAQLTLFQKAQIFARNNKLEIGGALAAIAAMSHAMVDARGSVVAHGLDGNLNLSLASGKVLKGWAQPLRRALGTVADSSPTSGGTINCNSSGLDDIQYWTPAGTIAAQTYVFPTDANSQLGQIIELSSSQVVTALTLSTSGLTLKGTSVTALGANTPVRWRKVAAATWLRLA